MKSVYELSFLLLLLFAAMLSAYAQVISDLSNDKAEQLSEEQVMVLMRKVSSSAASDMQIEGEARKRGITNSQIALLKRRMANLSEKEPTVDARLLDASSDVSASKGINQAYVAKEDPYDNRTKIYERSLFTRATPQFTPNLNMATSIPYVIGIGDRIDVLVYDDCETNHSLRVNKEGRIQVPYVGAMAVLGNDIGSFKV